MTMEASSKVQTIELLLGAHLLQDASGGHKILLS